MDCSPPGSSIHGSQRKFATWSQNWLPSCNSIIARKGKAWWTGQLSARYSVFHPWVLYFHHQPYPIHWQVLLVLSSNYVPNLIIFTTSPSHPSTGHHHLCLGTCITFPPSPYFYSTPTSYNPFSVEYEWSLKNVNHGEFPGLSPNG